MIHKIAYLALEHVFIKAITTKMMAHVQHVVLLHSTVKINLVAIVLIYGTHIKRTLRFLIIKS